MSPALGQVHAGNCLTPMHEWTQAGLHLETLGPAHPEVPRPATGRGDGASTQSTCTCLAVALSGCVRRLGCVFPGTLLQLRGRDSKPCALGLGLQPSNGSAGGQLRPMGKGTQVQGRANQPRPEAIT